MAQCSRQQVVKSLSNVCTHGKNVFNPKTGQMIYVACGHCAACLAAKASSKSIRAGVQRELSNYTFFFTLTYRVECMPKYVIKPVLNKPDLYFFKGLPRDPDKSYNKGLDLDNDFKGYSFMDPDQYRNFCNQGNLCFKTKAGNDKYPHLKNVYANINVRDFQLFMKRLRRYIYSKVGFYEKFHYYITSEYSPKHFLPHWHCLFSFDSPAVAKIFRQALSACWTYGRIDCSIAREDASSYVAGYLNSSSRIPLHLRKISEIRPRGRFSNGYGNDLFVSFGASVRHLSESSSESDKREVFDNIIDGFPYVVNGQILSVRPWRSYLDTLFFRPSKDCHLSVYEMARSIQNAARIYQRFLQSSPESSGYSRSCYGFARWLYDFLYSQLTPIERYDYYNVDCLGFADFLFDISSTYSHWSSEEIKTLFIGQTYRYMAMVFGFLRSCSHDGKSVDLSYLYFRLRLSQEFYSYRDYLFLIGALQNCEDYSDYEDLTDVILHPSEDSVSRFVAKSLFSVPVENYLKERSDAAIKHREINDLNLKFVYYAPKSMEI